MQRRWGCFVVVAVATVRAVAAWSLQTTIGGRTIDVDATLRLREVIEANRSSKHELTQQRLRLRVGAGLADWLRFDSTTVANNGGPTMRARRGGVYSWNQVFQDLSPSVDFEEAYFALTLPSLDVRIGKQKVAWGKLDSASPNDLLNPLSYIDPFLEDEVERKIGIPAIQATYYLPEAEFLPSESRLTVVWAKYLPYRFASAACDVASNQSRCDVERWFPPAGVPPTTFTIPAGSLPLPDGSPAPGLSLPLGYGVDNRGEPGWSLSDSEIGVRYSALVHDIDVDLYYFHGFDPQPAFDLTAVVKGSADANSPIGVSQLSAETVLAPKFVHIDSWGAAFAYAFDLVSVRGEGAFISGRAFPRDLRHLIRDPRQLGSEIEQAIGSLAGGAGQAPVALPSAAAVRSAFEWGVGADYIYDGYTLLLQLQQTDVLHNDVDLLIQDVETRVVANLRKSFLDDRLKAQVVAVHAIESDYTMVRPTLLYQVTDNASAQIGYLFLAGRSASLVGQYKQNDQGFVRLEYRL